MFVSGRCDVPGCLNYRNSLTDALKQIMKFKKKTEKAYYSIQASNSYDSL